MFFKAAVMVVALVSTVPFSLLAERRISAFIQDRLGPNRVGPFGLLQPLADVFKFIFKEDLVPAKANKFIHNLAPVLTLIIPLIVFAVIPFANVSWGNSTDAILFLVGSTGSFALSDIGIGILFILAIGSIGAYGLSYGGWASFSKYSLIGGMRASAQLISFELAMGLAIISIIMSSGTVDLNLIVVEQKGTLLSYIPNWFVFRQPLAFYIFLLTAFAETNRLPFDMPEAESELVGGYHTEYSGVKFAMFFMGEYVAMFSMSALIVTLFFGGWYFPGIESLLPVESTSMWLIGLASFIIFMSKVACFLFFFIWIRWTLPRVRWDQLMKQGWSLLIPLAILNIILTALFKYL